MENGAHTRGIHVGDAVLDPLPAAQTSPAELVVHVACYDREHLLARRARMPMAGVCPAEGARVLRAAARGRLARRAVQPDTPRRIE
jgi:hypothetical protein